MTSLLPAKADAAQAAQFKYIRQ